MLEDLFGDVLVPEEVYKEAVEKALKEGCSDALIIEETFNQGWIRISKLGEKEIVLCEKIMKHAFEIHAGEAQAMVLARKLGSDTLILMDESSGRAFAQARGLKVKGALFVIMTALNVN